MFHRSNLERLLLSKTEMQSDMFNPSNAKKKKRK